MDNFDTLSSLDATRTTWNVKVRVTRMWPSVSTSGKKETLKGYNLLILDEDNYHVHAFVYADTWTALSKKIKIEEGSLYSISNFYAKDAFGSMRPVSTKTLINFSNSTIVEKITDDDLLIPMHKFEFVDLGDLFALASSYEKPDSPEFSTDVIGVVEDYEELHVIKTMYGDKPIVKFRITDGRHSSKVSIWADLAVKTEDSKKKAVTTPIIAIITSTKLKIYKNSVQINTLPSSKVYLNLDTDSVIAMRQRLQEEGYTIPVADSPSLPQKKVQQIIGTMTLTQLSEITDESLIDKNVYCYIKVVTVEEKNWWYDTCGGCEIEPETIEGKPYCHTCRRNLPVAEKRYRIVILGEDAMEAFNFILLDRVGKRFIGTTATKLIAAKILAKTTHMFPPEIKALVGKELKLKLVISKDNVVANSRLYSAVDAWDPYSSSSSISGSTGTPASTSGFGDSSAAELVDPADTPNTAKSANKKMKMED